MRCIGTSQTSTAKATAKNDEERGNVLLVHTSHDAEHLRPVDEGREHCAPENEKRERNPCPHRRIRATRGSRRFRLFFLLRGTRRTNSVIAFKCAFAFFLSSLFSSSSNFFPEEELGRAGVHCLSHSVCQHRCREERPLGSHVTDRDCPNQHLWLLQDARVRTS